MSLNTILVKFDDPKFNYKTSVNGNCTFHELNEYFVGNTFFLGSSDADECDPNMWQTCRSIVLLHNLYIVIAGSFKGEIGTITNTGIDNCYYLRNQAGDRLLVTKKQIKEHKS